MADLNVKICGLNLINPVMAAAGPPTRNAELIKKCAEYGAGAVVSKTISSKAAMVPRPCMAYNNKVFLNTELWSELSPEYWIENEYKKAKTIDVPLIIGLGYTQEQLSDLVPKVDEFADAYEISCHYVGRDISPLLNSLKAVKKLTNKPVIMKISPGISDLPNVAQALEQNGADAIAAINSVGPCLSINLETGLPYMGSEKGYGWMSGSSIKPIALRHVYEIAGAVNIPVIGVGGVSNGCDVIEMMMAGASAVQICTQAILEGPMAFKRISKEADLWLDKHNYKSINDIKGITHHKVKNMDRPIYEARYPKVDESKCTGCGLCAKSCMYGAISIDKKAHVDENMCFGCSLCTTRCSFSAINF